VWYNCIQVYWSNLHILEFLKMTQRTIYYDELKLDLFKYLDKIRLHFILY